MIFPKQFLADALEKKNQKVFNQLHPWETRYNNGDKSPFELVLMNYFTFFDLKSNEVKNAFYNARKEIASSCFNSESMDVFPNTGLIEECIKRVNNKHYGKFLDKRNVYFGNSK
jgi:hypothetical protein